MMAVALPASPPSSLVPALLTLPEAAETLRCSVRTVQRRIAAGELRAYRDGRLVRVPAEEIRRYVRLHVAAPRPRSTPTPSARRLPSGSRLWAT